MERAILRRPWLRTPSPNSSGRHTSSATCQLSAMWGNYTAASWRSHCLPSYGYPGVVSRPAAASAGNLLHTCTTSRVRNSGVAPSSPFQQAQVILLQAHTQSPWPEEQDSSQSPGPEVGDQVQISFPPLGPTGYLSLPSIGLSVSICTVEVYQHPFTSASAA